MAKGWDWNAERSGFWVNGHSHKLNFLAAHFLRMARDFITDGKLQNFTGNPYAGCAGGGCMLIRLNLGLIFLPVRDEPILT